MADLHRHYLFDLGCSLRELALEAKREAQTAIDSEKGFQLGRLTSYYEVLSLLVSQARAFNLPIEDLHLNGLDPDRDLLV